MIEVDKPVQSGRSLREGMYVRVPVEDPRTNGSYRHYQLGRIVSIDDVANEATVRLFGTEYATPLTSTLREISINRLTRCRITPNAPFEHKSSGQRGRVLTYITPSFQPGMPIEYCCDFDGSIISFPEHEICVPANYQDPNPWDQLGQYEFHHPIWRERRNTVVEACTKLQNATFGVEELVGSRVHLLAHQAEVVTRVLSTPNCRYLLADEVGLGKTIEALLVLKVLRHHHTDIRALIVVPSAILPQWRNEIERRFWMSTTLVTPRSSLPGSIDSLCTDQGLNLLVSAEDLMSSDALWDLLEGEPWGLLIADEVHHLRKYATLYKRVGTLSALANRVLLLSATPIQRRAKEYLPLLRLLDPHRYGPLDPARFQRILAAQSTIRQAAISLLYNLTPDYFDPIEFLSGLTAIIDALGDDSALVELAARVEHASRQPDRGLREAHELFTYISENYRIESRMIRNRRASLQFELPQRTLVTDCSYPPGPEEATLLQNLYEFITAYLRETSGPPVALEYGRLLLHAAASSPDALNVLLSVRAKVLASGAPPELDQDIDFSILATPRDEPRRIRMILNRAPSFLGEESYVEQLMWQTGLWRDATKIALSEAFANRFKEVGDSSHRFLRVLGSLERELSSNKTSKILVFSSWYQTLDIIRQCLEQTYGPDVFAQFHSRVNPDKIQFEADRFQSDPRCRVLLCDELGGEGRNFQIASTIFHLDLPWTPALLEQRIGRVDRLGNTGTVQSIVTFAQGTLEHDLFRLWQDALSLFTSSMSGLEIALEDIQNQVTDALQKDVQTGLADLLPQLLKRVDLLREMVEEERYFEEGSINHARRLEFEQTNQAYLDGLLLGDAILGWADLVGLSPAVVQEIVTFNISRLSVAKMADANLFQLPSIPSLIKRSSASKGTELRGTFSRTLAMQQEGLVLFAPSNDLLTDAIIANAFSSDRGRTACVLRTAPSLRSNWRGFELLYSLGLDPRPLLQADCDTSHLTRGQGYVPFSTVKLIISTRGVVEDPDGPVAVVIADAFAEPLDRDLGDGTSLKANIREIYPPDEWKAILEHVRRVAQAKITSELTLPFCDAANKAGEDFAMQVRGWRASRRWLRRAGEEVLNNGDLVQFEVASKALVEGIKKPLVRLESACFWILKAGTA